MFRDLHLALRSLLRRPGLFLTCVLILALGIGATVAVSSMVHGVLLAPLPYRDGGELMVLEHGLGTDRSATVPFSIKEVEELQEQTATFEDVVEHHAMTFTLLGHGQPQRVSTGVVSARFFDVLGVKPLHGRGFVPADEEVGAEAVLVLSNATFQNEFGGDQSVVGQVFEMNNRPHTVVGVLPPIPQYPQEHDVYMPTSACPFRANAARQREENRGAFRALSVFGRLAQDESPSSALTDLERLGAVFAADHPETYPPDRGYFLQHRPLSQALVRDSRGALWMLALAGGLLLLLACASVANLMLVRGLRAAREQAVRSALGASRRRLVRASLAESLVIAGSGAAAGVGVALASLGLLRTFMARYTPRADSVGLEPAVLFFACGLTLLVALSVTAVLEVSRSSNFAALREGTRALGGRRSGLVRAGLIVTQVAVAVMLLSATGLLIKSLYLLQSEDAGVGEEEVLTARLSLNWSRYPDPASAAVLFDGLLQRLGDEPQVAKVALGTSRPLDGQAPFLRDVQIEGLPPSEDEVTPQTARHTASEGYFDALGIRLLDGRVFRASDDLPETFDPQAASETEGLVAVINQATRDLFFQGLDPLSRRISLDGGSNWWTVVGVVANVRHDLAEPPSPAVYTPLRQNGFADTLVVAGSSGVTTEALRELVVDTVSVVDPEQPVDAFRTVAASRRELAASPRTVGRLLAVFAGIALLVAAVGLGGLIAYAVSQRQREIGVRVALGARPMGVVALVWRDGLLLSLLGAVLGIGGALAVGRVLVTFLYGVEPRDPLSLGLAAATMLAVGALATLLPALRAARVQPTSALRAS